jgi:hypothetical protein
MSALWYDMTKEQFREVLRLSRVYYREATRCESAKAYLSGCVAAAAALEAQLVAIVHLYGLEVELAGFACKRAGRPKRLLDWSLDDLIRAAADMGWLPRGLKDGDRWNSRRARIGDHALVLKQVRNLVHPARYLRDHYRSA